jgi:AraC-like DNA-binding protein
MIKPVIIREIETGFISMMRMTAGIVMLILAALCGCSEPGRGERVPVSRWHIYWGPAPIDDPKYLANSWMPYNKEFPLNSNLVSFSSLSDEPAWLRGEFILKGGASVPYGLIVGGGGRSAKIFINGQLLEKPKDGRFKNVYSPEAYHIPNAFLHEGINTLHVKTHLMAGFSAITDDISIMDNGTFAEKTLVEDLMFTQIPMALFIFNFSILFPPLIFFLWNRRLKVLGFSAVILLVCMLYILFEFIPLRYTEPVIPQVHLAMVPLFIVLLLGSMQSLFRIYMRIFTRLIMPLCLFAIAGILLFNKKLSVLYSPYILLAGIIFFLPIFIIILTMMNRFKRDRLMLGVVIGFFSCAAIIAVLELINFIADGRYVFLITIYFIPVFVITFIMLAAREYMKSTIEMELLYNTIKKPEKKDKDPIITDNTESKLKSVIDFIHINYMQDISREGLAGAIDMSTDYMSRLFKTYTGKKISEYINELRIQEAMKKLKDREIKIIDIALSVGFESLSTFNRAFKNVTGTTPSEYRSQVLYAPPD